MATEKRLIDANALKSYINGVSTHWLNDWSTIGVLAAVDKQPTVDAVDVVRCKKCKHWLHMEDGMGDCTNSRFHLPGHADPTMNADDFCSCGERRTE